MEGDGPRFISFYKRFWVCGGSNFSWGGGVVFWGGGDVGGGGGGIVFEWVGLFGWDGGEGQEIVTFVERQK